MKSALTLLFISFAGMALSQADFKDAVQYNDYIISEQRQTVKKNLDYISFSVHSEDYKLIEAKRKEVLRQITQSKGKIAKMPPFEGDTRLRDEAIEVLAQYQNAFEGDFKEVLHLKKERQNSLEAMEAYFKAQNKAEDEVNKATQKFNKVQTDFAKKNNLTFGSGDDDDDLSSQMQTIASLNQYARGIFLEYFKVSKAFAEMLDVLNEQKGALLDRKRRDVIEAADKALPKLKDYGDFKGDREYLDQTVSLTEYYQRLAKNEFEKIATLFNKKSGITREDANYINQVLRDYNANAEMLVYNLNMANNDLLQKNIAPTQ